jgi:hypothetical protein
MKKQQNTEQGQKKRSPGEALAARIASAEPIAACMALAAAMDPKTMGEADWATVALAAQGQREKLAEGLKGWGRRSVVDESGPCRQAWGTVAETLGQKGQAGAVAARRFAEGFGQINVERRMGEISESAPEWQRAALRRDAAVHVGGIVADATLSLAEALGPNAPAAAAKAIRPWALAAMEHWGQETKKTPNSSVELFAERMFRLASALGERGAIKPKEARALGAAAMEACAPGGKRALWGHGSLLRAVSQGRLAMELHLGFRNFWLATPPSAAEWASAIGRGPESARRAEQLAEWGVLDQSLIDKILPLKRLDSSVRAKLESQALRRELGLANAGRGKASVNEEKSQETSGPDGEPQATRHARRRL